MTAPGPTNMPTPGPENGQAPTLAVSPTRRAPALGAVEFGLIALQAIFWGSTFFFIAVARRDIPPLTLSLVRLLPAVAFLWTVITVMGQRLPASWFEWRRLLIFSLLNNLLPFWLIIMAQREVTGGIAAIFMATAPLFSLILAPLLLEDELFTWRRLTGIMVGIAGVVILTGGGGAAGSWLAQAMLATAALCFSLANIFARKFLGGYHPFVVASSQTIGSLVLSVPLVLLFEPPWRQASPSGAVWLAVLVMGIVGSGLAPLCHFNVLRRAGPVNAMLSSIVVPVTPVVLGALFLGETMRLRELMGALVIAAALVIIDGRLPALIRRRWFT